MREIEKTLLIMKTGAINGEKSFSECASQERPLRSLIALEQWPMFKWHLRKQVFTLETLLYTDAQAEFPRASTWRSSLKRKGIQALLIGLDGTAAYEANGKP